MAQRKVSTALFTRTGRSLMVGVVLLSVLVPVSASAQVSGAESVDANVVELPLEPAPLSRASEEAPDRVVFATESTYLRGRVADTTSLGAISVVSKIAESDQRLLLRLFDDAAVELVKVERVEVPGTEDLVPGVSVWQSAVALHDEASLDGEQEAPEGFAVIVAVDETLLIDLTTPDGKAYTIDTLSASGNALQIGELDLAQANERGDIGVSGTSHPPIEEMGDSAIVDDLVVAPVSRYGNVLQDVLVVYTADARSALGNPDAVTAHAAARVSEANTAYNRSDIDITLRLIDVIEIGFDEVAGSDGNNDLANFPSDPEVVQNRDYGGADLVVLLGRGWTYCGRGGPYPGTDEAIVDVVGCSAHYTFAHEVGHIQGAGHDPGHGNGYYSYSHGHFVDDASIPERNFRTMMSYDSYCLDGPCPRFLNFSNPDIDLWSEPTGTSTRDNARTLDNTASSVAATESPVPLTDVYIGADYYLPVGWMKATGITSGCNPPLNTKFCPSNYANRAELMVFLWKTQGAPTNGSWSEPFTDVGPGDWFYNAVKWAYSTGLTNGCNPPDNDEFCPYRTVNRYEGVVFMWRANGSPTNGSWTEPYSDVTTQWWAPAVKWAYQNVNQTIIPYSGSYYSPYSGMKRSDIASFLWGDEYR
jgi:hypothetical protein